MARQDLPPRKAIIGTVIRGFWSDPPGLDHRIAVACDCIDSVAAASADKYDGRGPDLIALPENAVQNGNRGTAAERAVDLEGAVLDAFSAKAREHNTYIVLPMVLATDRANDVYHNAAVLIDRSGEIVGIYRKVHPVSKVDRDYLEGGMTPGDSFPVFDTDFGRVGMQICFDMVFDDGWDALAEAGADLVVWPTASPARAQAGARAGRGRYYIVSSTYRHNATIYEPTGLVAAQVTEPDDVLVHEIDLSYMVMHWSMPLANGQAFTDAFGDRAGYRFDEIEDVGIFWSNDPTTPIARMAEQIGVREVTIELARNKRLQDAARGKPMR